MKWLVNYVKSLFCEHEFNIHRGYMFKKPAAEYAPKLTGSVTYICKKCGYGKRYWTGEG